MEAQLPKGGGKTWGRAEGDEVSSIGCCREGGSPSALMCLGNNG